MSVLSETEKQELLRLAVSSSMKDDMMYLTANRHNPVIVNGKADMNRLVAFLTEFNEFINHDPKPFKPMIDRDMRL